MSGCSWRAGEEGFLPPYMLFSLLLAFAGESHSALPTGVPHDTLFAGTIRLSPSTTRTLGLMADGFAWEQMLNLERYGTEVDRGEPYAHRLPAASSVELSLAAGSGV